MNPASVVNLSNLHFLFACIHLPFRLEAGSSKTMNILYGILEKVYCILYEVCSDEIEGRYRLRKGHIVEWKNVSRVGPVYNMAIL